MAADLFKIPVTEYWLNPGTDQARRVQKDAPGAVAVKKQSKKWYARIAVQQLLLDALEGLHLKWPVPELDVAMERDLVERS